MARATYQTVPTRRSVARFLAAIEDPRRRKDAQALARRMRAASGERPVMWGPAIVGFGRYAYRYASGREGEMPLIAFAPRKASLVLYLMGGRHAARRSLKRLGPHRVQGSCLHLKSLAGVDLAVLERMLALAADAQRRRTRGARRGSAGSGSRRSRAAPTRARGARRAHPRPR